MGSLISTVALVLLLGWMLIVGELVTNVALLAAVYTAIAMAGCATIKSVTSGR